jgi:diguanylate cyclase (GGDEF)-like protein
MGTLVTYGRGKGLVTSTGMTTQLGMIAEMLQSYEEEQTPLQQKLDQLGRTLGTAALAICMIDLDDFKPVNDVYGHGIGDQLLTAVAQRLRSYLREGDCVGRIGGDEFIAVFRGCPERQLALILAQRIRDGLNQPFQLGEHLIRIGASVGVVLDAEQPLAANLSAHPGDAASNAAACLENLVKLADRAMYLVKQNGKRRVAIAPKGSNTQ